MSSQDTWFLAGQLLSRKPAVPKVCRNVEKGILFAFFLWQEGYGLVVFLMSFISLYTEIFLDSELKLDKCSYPSCYVGVGSDSLCVLHRCFADPTQRFLSLGPLGTAAMAETWAWRLQIIPGVNRPCSKMCMRRILGNWYHSFINFSL